MFLIDFLYICSSLDKPNSFRSYYGERVRDGQLTVVQNPSKELMGKALTILMTDGAAA